MATRLKLHPMPRKSSAPLTDTARAYDTVATADFDRAGREEFDLFGFHGHRAFSDRKLWARLDATLVRMWTEGRRAISILDLGCGSGDWLLRLAVRARDLGFSAIDGRGVDIAPGMIALARARQRLASDPHIGLRFDVADMIAAMEEEDERSFDIVLCLHGVLNHCPAERRRDAIAAIERVADGEIFVSAHGVGGRPSIDLVRAFDARQLDQDNEADRLTVHLQDGRCLTLPSHLFTAAELSSLFSGRVQRQELIGLDLLHARFDDDPHWNPAGIDHAGRDDELDRLEHLCEAMPAMIDSACQILFHGRIGPALASV